MCGEQENACHGLCDCVRVHQHMISDDMGIPSPAVLVLSGLGVPKNGWGLGGGEAPKMFLHKI